MPYRVIQWATGNVGRAAVEGILSHPELELVGTWVHDPAKAGRDVGEICGLAPIGVRATGDVDAILATAADCVLYSPLLPQLDEVVRLLESGKNVVTPVGWFYPFHTPGMAELEAACHRGGVTLHGTGIHPGGITELMPLTISSLSRNVRHVRAEEFSDIRVYRAELVVKEIMLFGKRPEDAAREPDARAPRRRLRPVDRHAGRVPRLPPRRREARRATRWRSPPRRSRPRSACSPPARSRRSASPGRARSTARRS